MARDAIDLQWSDARPLVPPRAITGWLERLELPIAVTGGTGFVGSHLVDTLCAAGIRARVLVRSATAPRWLLGRQAEWVLGSLEDEVALAELVREAGTVFHIAGVLRGANESEFMAGNRDGTARVVDAMTRHAPGAQLIYVSSQAAVGPSPTADGLGPGAPANPISAYGRSKLAAEAEVCAFAGRWSIVRPPAIYGPRDTDIFEFFRLASRGLLALPSGERWITVAFVADVVEAVIAAAAVAAPGSTYHIGERSPYRMDEMLRIIAKAGRVRARLRRIPPVVFRAAGAGASLLRLLGMRLPLSLDKSKEILARHWTMQTAASHDALGIEGETPFADGARATWDWYREMGWLP